MPAHAQLHLITGYSTPMAGLLPAELRGAEMSGYDSYLLRVGSDGSVKRVAKLADAVKGANWIAVSHEWRKAVVAPKDVEDPFLVVDFDEAAVVKTCRDGHDPDLSVMNQWLVDSPTRGPVFAQDLFGGMPRSEIRAMVLDPSVPCDRSFSELSVLEAKYRRVSGFAGAAQGAGSQDEISTVDHDGQGRFWGWFPQGLVYYDYQIPAELYRDFPDSQDFLEVDSRDALVLVMVDWSNRANQRMLIFRKSDRTWRRAPALSERLEVRGLPGFLALMAKQSKTAAVPESAGEGAWRKGRTRSGPSIDDVFHGGVVYPGRMYLYEVATEHIYPIVTNQADSEVLLVEGGTVYYRASNRLYSAPITDAGIGHPRLLATDEAIRDAHWAFIKH
jgi:hypothetical protein